MEGKINITSAKYVANEIKGSGHAAIKAVIESINKEGELADVETVSYTHLTLPTILLV